MTLVLYSIKYEATLIGQWHSDLIGHETPEWNDPRCPVQYCTTIGQLGALTTRCSSRRSTSREIFLALYSTTVKGSARLCQRNGPRLRASIPSSYDIVCEKLHPLWAVTHHLTGHTRVQGFHRSTYPLSLQYEPMNL